MRLTKSTKAGIGVCVATLLGGAHDAFAHGVQVGYGTLPNGFVRVYVEHWHGDNPGLQNSPLNITITSGSGTTTAVYNAAGQVPNTAWNNLPFLGGSINILAQCPSRANTYNDWLFWDFAPGSCDQPVSIQINSGTTAVTAEGCAILYPQTITGQVFTDQGAPVITAPDISVVGDCAGSIVNFNSTVVDDCDQNPTVTYSHASGSFFPVGVTPVTITAQDSTGKIATKTFNVTVIASDTQAPTLTLNPGVSVVQLNASYSDPGATAVDNCGLATVTVTGAVDTSVIGAYTLTYTAADASGNVSAPQTRVVNVVDTTAPALICPPAFTVECDGLGNGAELSAWLASVVASDNSGQVSVSYEVTDGASTSTRSFPDFSDLSGFQLNGSAATMGNPVNESGNNVLRLTSDLSQSGSAFLTDPIDLAADASFSSKFAFQIDNNQNTGADGITFTVQTVSNTAGGSGGGIGYAGIPNSVAIEFDTWDNGAGNSDFNGSHVGINLNGNIASVATVAISPALDSGVVWHSWVDYNGATDQLEVRLSTSDVRPEIAVLVYNVDLVNTLGQTSAFVGFTSGTGAAASHHDILNWEFNNSFKPIGAEPCGGTSETAYRFTAVDPSGNTTVCVSTFSVVDTTAPTIASAASDMTVECDGLGNAAALNAWLASVAGAVATDSCGSVVWTHNFGGLSNGAGATGTATVTFTATDACGNASATQATFNIVDTTAPVIVQNASSATVEVDGSGNAAELNAWLNNNGGASAADSCGGVTWANDFAGLSDDCGATGSAVVTFIATDESGNSSTTVATFAVVDTTAPVISPAASNMVVECDGSGNLAELGAWLNANGGASASDVGGSVTWSHNFAGLLAQCGGTGAADVTFTATDECGNASSTTASFTIVDTTAPVITSDVRDILPNETPITFSVASHDTCGNATLQLAIRAYAIKKSGEEIDRSGSVVVEVIGGTVTVVKSGGVGTIIEITAIAQDDCGNATTEVFTVTVLRPANEGVGNGEDGNTPGHDNNGGNDGPGTSPGNPGARNK